MDEVRPEWLPLSASATSPYEPPVARFHVQHFRNLPISSAAVASGSELISLIYNKKLATSYLRVYISMTYLLEHKGTSSSEVTLNVYFNAQPCTSPAALKVLDFMVASAMEIGTPIVISGVCAGIGAGDVTISLKNIHIDAISSDVRAPWLHVPHVIIEEIHDGFVTIV